MKKIITAVFLFFSINLLATKNFGLTNETKKELVKYSKKNPEKFTEDERIWVRDLLKGAIGQIFVDDFADFLSEKRSINGSKPSTSSVIKKFMKLYQQFYKDNKIFQPKIDLL